MFGAVETPLTNKYGSYLVVSEGCSQRRALRQWRYRRRERRNRPFTVFCDGSFTKGLGPVRSGDGRTLGTKALVRAWGLTLVDVQVSRVPGGPCVLGESTRGTTTFSDHRLDVYGRRLCPRGGAVGCPEESRTRGVGSCRDPHSHTTHPDRFTILK